jgi:hypothetical protein
MKASNNAVRHLLVDVAPEMLVPPVNGKRPEFPSGRSLALTARMPSWVMSKK